MLFQVAKYHSFYGWLIFHWFHLFYPFIHQWTSKLSWLLWRILQWTWKYMYFFQLVFSFSLDKYSEVELQDLIMGLCLIFWDISILFYIVPVPICTPTNDGQEFSFLHILANTCYVPVVLICIFLTIYKGEQLFIYLLANCMSSLEKCLFKSFAHFFSFNIRLFRLFCYCIVWIISIFCISVSY